MAADLLHDDVMTNNEEANSRSQFCERALKLFVLLATTTNNSIYLF